MTKVHTKNMALKIGIGLSFYQDFDSLRRMLMSLQGYPIDRLIAIDGSYEGYPAEGGLSHEACRELITTFQTPFLTYPYPRVSEIQKRQKYFDLSYRFSLDVLIVMDSDEYIIHDRTNWPLFVDELEQKIEDHKQTWIQSYCIPVNLKNKGEKQMPFFYTENLPRVFVRPSELQYVDNHYMVRNKRTGVLMRYPSETLLHNLTLGHDHTLRTKEFMEQRKIYQERLIEEEKNRMLERQNEFAKGIS
jgi:hypothetical protein